MIETRQEPRLSSYFSSEVRSQSTIKNSVSFTGIGVFSGRKVNMVFHPLKADQGICFKRMDLDNQPTVKACTANLQGTQRCTILHKNGVQIQCVEHVLSALAAFGVDNLLIELDSLEPPILDGSSLGFCQKLQEAEVVRLDEQTEDLCLVKPVYISEGNAQIVALPSDQLKISYTLSYPNHPMLAAQFCEFEFSLENYMSQIAPCRTFVLHEEVKVLIDRGVIKGANLDHGVVIDGDKVLNEGGVRFIDEMARHKALDLIGDLFLTKKNVRAHFIAIRSGHRLNTELAKELDYLMEDI